MNNRILQLVGSYNFIHVLYKVQGCNNSIPIRNFAIGSCYQMNKKHNQISFCCLLDMVLENQEIQNWWKYLSYTRSAQLNLADQMVNVFIHTPTHCKIPTFSESIFRLQGNTPPCLMLGLKRDNKQKAELPCKSQGAKVSK